MTMTKEIAFEDAIETSLLVYGGYIKGTRAHYDVAMALDPVMLLAFLRETQPDAWAKLETYHGANVETKFLQRLVKELDARGTLDVLRHGVTDYGVSFRLAYFRPMSGRNPDALTRYAQNRLTVTRQLHYSAKDTAKSLDLVLAVNGLPVATAELKSHLTGQTVENARWQYRTLRDPKELLFQFKRRALVHFAVDPDEVAMTTRLAGEETSFLPFNRGRGKGGGNPDNATGYKTAYLWEEVWHRDQWLDILGRFLHLEVKDEFVGDKKVRRESLIFPRYHQLDAVRKVVTDARARGAGQHYLVQHSAGSGKSNTIAWLAHRLAILHNDNDETVFDSVVVVTDRRVLDRQLQDTIFQFEHKQGVVQKIDENSTQLAQALQAGTLIIITTLQKFPFVLDKIGTLPNRRYAVIVDEAHSSQTGEAAHKLKEVLAVKSLEEASKEDEKGEKGEDEEDVLNRSMAARGRQPNLSFFAFTATPKAKTLALFGTPGPDGLPRPFHLYSMRQAIEEGFILDVLRGYTTYSRYFKLTKAVEGDPEVDRKKAARGIARFVNLHPHNIAQKTEVIVEHFRQFVRGQIGGRAKAMVVTSSRLHAVRYKQAVDRYIADHGYDDLKALVAFSGTVHDEFDLDYTESGMNGFGERQLPEKFDTSEYQVLIVADKYQTGFDQPLLHTMYVDKRLAGVRAVQTLSRLNRPFPGKDSTLVLDFVNNPEEIERSFQPYYEGAHVEEETDPNALHDLVNELDGFQIYWQSEVDTFSKVFFKPQVKQTVTDQAALNAALDPAVDRFRHESQTRQTEFQHLLATYVRLYAFMAQLVPFQDAKLERLYAYGRFLLRKLPRGRSLTTLSLDNDVALQYYRLRKVAEGDIVLEVGAGVPVKGPTDVGTGEEELDGKVRLSEVIDVVNARFGTEFTTTDQLLFNQFEEALVADEQLAEQAQSNTMENFKYGFDDRFMDLVIGRMDENSAIFAKLMDDTAFAEAVKQVLLTKVFQRLKETPSNSDASM